jgi:four helix bundle protein
MPKEMRYPKSEIEHVQQRKCLCSSDFWEWAVKRAEALLHDAPEGDTGVWDLLERTARFGEAVIGFAKRVPRGIDKPENARLVDQLVGAGTSIGANYCEADDSVSGKDFRNKIGICRKESKETMFFLRMIAASEPTLADQARTLWREAKELNLIFGSIWRKTA